MMTTYIDNALSAVAEPSTGVLPPRLPFNPAAQMEAVVPSLLALWTLPFQAFQIWSESLSSLLASLPIPSSDAGGALSPAQKVDQVELGQELYA